MVLAQQLAVISVLFGQPRVILEAEFWSAFKTRKIVDVALELLQREISERKTGYSFLACRAISCLGSRVLKKLAQRPGLQLEI